MERAILLRHLEEERRHVAEASEHVSWQRKVVAELTPDADVTKIALELLRLFDEALATQVGERERLERQLEQLQLPERQCADVRRAKRPESVCE